LSEVQTASSPRVTFNFVQVLFSYLISLEILSSSLPGRLARDFPLHDVRLPGTRRFSDDGRITVPRVQSFAQWCELPLFLFSVTFRVLTYRLPFFPFPPPQFSSLYLFQVAFLKLRFYAFPREPNHSPTGLFFPSC